MELSREKTIMISKMTSLRQDQFATIVKESERLSKEKGKRVSEAEVIRQAIDFYFSHRSKVE